MQVQWDAQTSVTDMINEGVRQAYTHPDNVLRASILSDPDGEREKYWGQYPSDLTSTMS